MAHLIWIIGTVVLTVVVGSYYLWLSQDASRVSERMRRLPIGRTQSRLQLTGLAAYAIGALAALQYALGLNMW